MHTLTLFYDGCCPLCVAEMRALSTRDTQQALVLEDIQQEDFVLRYPHINLKRATERLHAESGNGDVLLGLDATRAAWAAVAPRSFTTLFVTFLRWPLVRCFSDAAYGIFARHRYGFSRLLTGRSRCDRCKI
ncbi:thiol-disulfide oxidoreductase DCC family protein [Teredinibacter purpureus]|uniref:thiol-disulfide oxidoreductase DCC family protein n=1 Tax=Teredinibacter purpureus TaxID=2731756 RepID=UPI0009E50C23|nr:DUF393 domain-containing protein [Teredinibacter purpureus]